MALAALIRKGANTNRASRKIDTQGKTMIRTILHGIAAAALLGTSLTAAVAQEPITVGILIPGSKSDKGWMESGYNGLVAAQQKYGDKIKVQMIENINYADMGQALTQLASGYALVIGLGGQTQADMLKVAPRFPDVKFSVVGGNAGIEMPSVAGYDVKQAEIAFVAGAAAAMLSKTVAISYVGGMEIPSIVNAGKEFGNDARYINPEIKYVENYTGDFDDGAKSKEATLAAIAQGADIHSHILNFGLRGMEQAASEKGTHIIGSYTNYCGTDPLYPTYSITGVGYQVSYAIDQAVAGTWAASYKPFGLAMGPDASGIAVCAPTPEITEKLDQIMDDIKAGTITLLEG